MKAGGCCSVCVCRCTRAGDACVRTHQAGGACGHVHAAGFAHVYIRVCWYVGEYSALYV